VLVGPVLIHPNPAASVKTDIQKILQYTTKLESNFIDNNNNKKKKKIKFKEARMGMKEMGVR
jgi:hypothetical protein